jgi:RNA polymerase sigma-70 factor (ECF subfamily)
MRDSELIEEIRKYKSRAVEELYDRYSSLIYTVAKKIAPDDKTAEEVVVDVFSIIWKRAGETDFNNSCVYTWIINLTRNRAIDLLKRSRSPEATLDYYDDEFEEMFVLPHLSPEIENYDISHVLKNVSRIENALDKLTDAQKYVIHLAYYEGYNINEISEKLGIPKETVRSKIYTSLKSLGENFEAEL